jgi:hypothetical protein
MDAFVELFDAFVGSLFRVIVASVDDEFTAMLLTLVIFSFVASAVITPVAYLIAVRVMQRGQGEGQAEADANVEGKGDTGSAGCCRCRQKKVASPFASSSCARHGAKPLVLKLRVAGEGPLRRLVAEGRALRSLSAFRACVQAKLATSPPEERTAADVRAAKIVSLVVLPDGIALTEDADLSLLVAGTEVEATLKYG